MTSIFVRFLNVFFRLVGQKVADHPIIVICIMMIPTAIFSAKFALTEAEDDLVGGYIPSNARLDEIEAYKSFNGGRDPILTYILIMAKDGGTMNRIEHLNATVDIMEQIANDFAVKNITYSQICDHFCSFNEPVKQFRNAFMVMSDRPTDHSSSTASGFINNLSYPIPQIAGFQYDLTSNFFGVTTYNKSEMTNETITNIKELRMILLQFRARCPVQWSKDDATKWDRSISNFYINVYNNSFVKPLVFSVNFAQDEAIRAGSMMQPYSTLGFAVITVFSLITVYINSKKIDQWSPYKIVYALCAGVCPLLATTTALGLLFALGMRCASIVGVAPFLVLAVGVDDCYLMINSWADICANRRSLPIRHDTLRDRMVEVLLDVGPSITITSMTNVVAFAMSIPLSVTDIQLFSTACACALTFSYFYMFTLYLAIMCLSAEREMKNECSQKRVVSKKEGKFLERYCEWLSNPFTSLFLLLYLCAYWYISARGTLSAKPAITTNKMFLKGSPIHEMSRIQEKYILPNYTPVTIFVNKPGNLSDTSRVNRIKEMVADFEALPECNGAEFTNFWIRDYEKFVSFEREDYDSDSPKNAFQDIREFTEWPEYAHWGGFMRFDNRTNELSAFYITVAYHGENLFDPLRRSEMLKRWRKIADNYAELSVTVFADDSLDLDLLETLVPSTLNTSLITLACMAVVCAIFMNNFFTLIIAVGSIISICLGVFGLLMLWGIDVDPFSIAAIAIAIGLSVDFPAHITYHYYRTGFDSRLHTPKARLYHSLTAIGFPLLQCSGSTTLFILCLLFIPCYMSEVFVKTIVLVTLLGIVHALVVVPALLCTCSNVYELVWPSKCQKISERVVAIVCNDESR